jgi:hypothetical protein
VKPSLPEPRDGTHYPSSSQFHSRFHCETPASPKGFRGTARANAALEEVLSAAYGMDGGSLAHFTAVDEIEITLR